MPRDIPYPPPGEILLEEFLKPMGITQYRLAKEIGVPQRRIGEIIAGKRSVTHRYRFTPFPFFRDQRRFLDRITSRLRYSAG